MKRKSGSAAVLLRIVLWCAAGSLLIHGVWLCVDYKTHPEIYEANSAPWYTGLIPHGAIAAAVTAVCLAALWGMRRKDRS